MKRIVPLVLLGALLLLAACAPGPNTLLGVVLTPGEKVAGFWLGLWHGLITPITFVVSLFTREVNVYEVHNNGAWYNFGYLMGVITAFGGGGGAAGRRKRR